MITHSDVIPGYSLSERDEILSVFSKALPRALREMNSSEVMNVIRTGNGFPAVLKRVMAEYIEVRKKANVIFPIVVDYSKYLYELVRAGEYDFIHPDIRGENFVTERSGVSELDLELVSFGRLMASDWAMRELRERNLRPAELYETLVFGAMHKKVQFQFPIVALGSSCRDADLKRRHVPVLWGKNPERYLDLHDYHSMWPSNYRFAAVQIE